MVYGLETGILLPNNQRQHRTSHAAKDVLPLRICANYCAPCQPLLRWCVCVCEDRVLDGPASGEKGSKGGLYKYCNPRT